MEFSFKSLLQSFIQYTRTIQYQFTIQESQQGMWKHCITVHSTPLMSKSKSQQQDINKTDQNSTHDQKDVVGGVLVWNVGRVRRLFMFMFPMLCKLPLVVIVVVLVVVAGLPFPSLSRVPFDLNLTFWSQMYHVWICPMVYKWWLSSCINFTTRLSKMSIN